MGKKEAAEVTYHFTYAIAEVQIWEDSSIVWEHRLGNLVLIGDGVTSSTYIPNAWLKKYFFEKGSGYKKLYPQEIKLYKNSLDNPLTENTHFTYNPATGLITFLSVPQTGDLVCGTWTYDPSRPEQTTIYADFSTKDLLKKMGLKPYKYEDAGLSTYEAVCKKGIDLMEELHKNIFPGNITTSWNPKVQVGQSILVKDDKTGLKKIYFIESITENHSGKDHSIRIQAISFPEDEYMIAENVLYKYSYKYELFLPQLILNFIEHNDPNTSPDTSYHDDMFYFVSKVYNASQELDEYYADDTKIKVYLPYLSPNKIRIFENSEWINIPDLRPSKGVISQAYDISFHKHTNGEYITDAEFNTAFPELASNADQFFEKKLCAFKIYNPSVAEFAYTIQQHMLIGRKPINYSVNTAFGYPMPRRITVFGRGTHIIFIDKDNDMWMCDLMFNTKKLGSAYDSGAGKIPEILTTDGRIIGMFYLGGNPNWNLKYWNLDTGAWVNIGNAYLYEAGGGGNDGTLYHYKPQVPTVDANGNNILLISAFANTTPPSNRILLLKGNTITVNSIPTNGYTKYATAPIMFNNLIWMGNTGVNKTTYIAEEDMLDSISFPEPYWWEKNLIFFTDTTKSTLYAIYAHGAFNLYGSLYYDFFTLIKRANSTAWTKIGTWYTPSGTTLWFYPLFAVGNKVAIFLRGSAINNWYGISASQVNCKALAIIDTVTKKLNLISIREKEVYDGEGFDVYGNEKFTIWFNNMCLWQWCDYSNVINNFDAYQVEINAGETK